MTEAELREGKRIPPAPTIHSVLLVLVICSCLCNTVYLWLSAPAYVKIELPTEGAYSDWRLEERTISTRRGAGGVYRHYIWQRIGVFDTTESADVTAALDDWIVSQGWWQFTEIYNFGLARFNPCQQLYDDASDINCFYYVPDRTDPKTRAFMTICGNKLAALYVEYSPRVGKVVAVVTTTSLSVLGAIDCIM